MELTFVDIHDCYIWRLDFADAQIKWRRGRKNWDIERMQTKSQSHKWRGGVSNHQNRAIKSLVLSTLHTSYCKKCHINKGVMPHYVRQCRKYIMCEFLQMMQNCAVIAETTFKPTYTCPWCTACHDGNWLLRAWGIPALKELTHRKIWSGN